MISENGRRSFLGVIFALAAGVVAVPSWLESRQRTDPRPPVPGQKPGETEPEIKPDPQALLRENQKSIKKDVARLVELAGELKKEVDKTDSTDVLSLQMVRKAEEIEKLARQIKNLARG